MSPLMPRTQTELSSVSKCHISVIRLFFSLFYTRWPTSVQPIGRHVVKGFVIRSFYQRWDFLIGLSLSLSLSQFNSIQYALLTSMSREQYCQSVKDNTVLCHLSLSLYTPLTVNTGRFVYFLYELIYMICIYRLINRSLCSFSFILICFIQFHLFHFVLL